MGQAITIKFCKRVFAKKSLTCQVFLLIDQFLKGRFVKALEIFCPI